MWNDGLDEAQAGIKIAGRNINNLRYADHTNIVAESEDELKILLMKMKEESEKVGLKLSIQKTKITASGPITPWQIDGETMETVRDFTFGAPKSLQMVSLAMKLKDACFLKNSHDHPRQYVKRQRYYIVNKCPSSQSYVFSSSHVRMWEQDHKESLALKNWCFWTVVLEKTLESPLDCK